MRQLSAKIYRNAEKGHLDMGCNIIMRNDSDAFRKEKELDTGALNVAASR